MRRTRGKILNLKSLLEDFRSGENILLESKDVVIALSHGAAWIFTENERYVITGPGGDDSGILSLLSKGSANNDYSVIVEMIRPLSKLYPYEKIEGELKADILKRGINKIFNQVRLNDLENSIVIGAIFEAFTGETLKGELGNTVKMVLTSPGTPYEKVFYNPPKDASTKNMEVRTVTIREAIEHEKKSIDPLTRGFPEALLFWNEWPNPVKVSQNLFEKIDDNNRPEERLLAIPVSKKFAPYGIAETTLNSDVVKLSTFHKTAVFAVLARLYRMIPSNNFWVIKGKATKEITSLAEENNAYIIDTETIRQLTNIKNEDQLKAIKAALWDLPFIDLWIRFNEGGLLEKFKSQIVFRQELYLKDHSRILAITLPKSLWGDDRFVLIEPWAYPSLHALPGNKQKPASRLIDFLMTKNSRENGKRTSYISLKVAADCIGYGSRLNARHKNDTINTINEYLNDLCAVGAIEAWELQENGAYKVIIGV